MHEGAREAEFLLHAAGKATGESRGEGTETRHVHQFLVARRPRLTRQTLQVGVEVQVLLYREVLVEAETLGHVTDGGLNPQGIAVGIETEHVHRACVGAQ